MRDIFEDLFRANIQLDQLSYLLDKEEEVIIKMLNGEVEMPESDRKAIEKLINRKLELN